MALNPSGPLSAGGPATGISINLELVGLLNERSNVSAASLGDNVFRCLANVSNGTRPGDGSFQINTTSSISMSNFYGRGLPTSVEYLVVAGGGGGHSGTIFGGGGGAGGFLWGNANIVAGCNYEVIVGAGGSGTAPSNFFCTFAFRSRGGNSVFGSVTACGGGGGGGHQITGPAAINWQAYPAETGGSGGGGGYCRPACAVDPKPGAAGTPGQGNSGGSALSAPSSLLAAGGGGGACSAGSNGSAFPVVLGGAGGAGCYSTITGSNVAYAGGGGGGASIAPAASPGGVGGGGQGSRASPVISNATAGTVNTGGGGGGGSITPSLTNHQMSQSGGSGIVVLAYSSNIGPIPYISPSLTFTVSCTSRPGFHVYCFTSGRGVVRWGMDPGNIRADVLVVAGGGSGGSAAPAIEYAMGGGGAGGLILTGAVLRPNVLYTVTVGAGAPGTTVSPSPVAVVAPGSTGSNSVFANTAIGLAFCAKGGGGGAAGLFCAPLYPTVACPGQDGGSGGGMGGGGTANFQAGGRPIDTAGAFIGNGIQGYEGGNRTVAGPAGGGGGGGGGASQCGQHAAVPPSTSSNGGNGGAGRATTIAGPSTTYGGGGGGGGGALRPTFPNFNASSAPGGIGGAGGGGNGGGPRVSTPAPLQGCTTWGCPGTVNTGGGGGGGGGQWPSTPFPAHVNCGGGGGSGIVIVAYPDCWGNIASVTPGLTYTAKMPGAPGCRAGYRVYCFTAGTGTICWS